MEWEQMITNQIDQYNQFGSNCVKWLDVVFDNLGL